jgi:(2S)-methylsuccinyl-CoA dehydrogenase
MPANAAPRFEDTARDALAGLEALLADATAKVRGRVVVEGHAVSRLIDREQRAAHGLAWLATYVEALRQLVAYAERLSGGDAPNELEDNLIRIAFGEFVAQIVGGIPISQGEIVRPADMGLTAAEVAARINPACEALMADGNTAASIDEGLADYNQAEDLILQDMPNIPMWFGRTLGAYNEDVSNVEVDKFGNLDFTKVTVSQ